MDDAVEFLELQERVAKSGRRYFIGKLGDCPVVLLKDEHATLDPDVVGCWTLFIKSGPDRRWAKKPKSEPQPSAPPPSSQPAAPAARRPTEKATQAKAARAINQRLAHVGLNDEIGF